MQKKNIALAAPLTSYSGYGQYGRSIANMLIQTYQNTPDINIILYDLGSGNTGIQQLYDIQSGKYNRLSSYIQPLSNMQAQFFDVFMTVSVPMAFLSKGLINIGITALVETDKVHPNLIQHCNRMDQVFVMSQFNIDSLKHSMYKLQDGSDITIKVPVQKLPHAFSQIVDIGIRTDITQFIDEIPQQFLFLTVGHWLPGSVGNDRKDIGSLIATFLQSFGNDQNVGLVLKVDQGRSSVLSQYSIRQRLHQICSGIGLTMNNCNVYFISGDLSQSQMLQIYTHDKIKAMISFTHGQSFGIPIMQFSGNTGKPLLVPYHSGMLQYIKPQYTEVLINKPIPVPKQLFNTFYKQFFIPESNWYVIDYQYAIYKMKQLVKQYSKLLQRSKLQQKCIMQQFSVSALSKTLELCLAKYIIQQSYQ